MITKVRKIIHEIQPIDLEVEDITLLSIEEYEAAMAHTVVINNGAWWLRSPVIDDGNAACVVGLDGYVFGDGYDVGSHFGVRPALKVNLASANLSIGDQIQFNGRTWTMINENTILCDVIVGDTAFRKNSRAKDANDYEKSDVKKWLHAWWKMQNSIRYDNWKE